MIASGPNVWRHLTTVARNQPPEDSNRKSFPQDLIIPVPPSAPPHRPVGACGNNRAVFPGRHAEEKPPNQRVRRPLFSLCRWLLCRDSRMKRNSGAQYGTQKSRSKPYRLTPTLSRSFVVAPFRLGLVWLSVLSTLPPNPSACPRVSVWDKPWDKFANYFETASPQFHFCPGDKNGLVLRP